MKKLLLQCLRLFLKISNHAALLLPHVKQTDDQRKRVGAWLLYHDSLLYVPGYWSIRWIYRKILFSNIFFTNFESKLLPQLPLAPPFITSEPPTPPPPPPHAHTFHSGNQAGISTFLKHCYMNRVYGMLNYLPEGMWLNFSQLLRVRSKKYLDSCSL
jgi:hypothetical protein